MKLKLDQNIPVEAANILQETGIDAVTVYQQDMSGIPDADLIAMIQPEERVLVTLDLDFSDIRAYPPAQYHGIIVLRPAGQDKAAVLSLINRLGTLLLSEHVEQRLWIVDNNRVRIRE
jgi:predicted nuclease of predicted toxin-antitoxin system